jgi:hypothetical protein
MNGIEGKGKERKGKGMCYVVNGIKVFFVGENEREVEMNLEEV